MATQLQKTIYDIAMTKAIRAVDLNAYVSLTHFDENQWDGPLGKYAYFAKDNICTRTGVTTGGSNFLFDFVAGYDATVIEKLYRSGAIMLGKANMDEFGLGGTGTFGLRGPVLNPHDKTRVTGGSSSGSAALVAAKVCDFALGTDTGDSIRRPASYVGVYGFKPSYGLVSRYGVFPYAPTLDHVGAFANSLPVLAEVMDAIAGFDPRDATSVLSNNRFVANLAASKGKLGVIRELDDQMDPKTLAQFQKVKENCAKHGLQIVEVSFSKQLLEAMLPTYNILSYAEAASCYSNLTGVNFGMHADGTFEEAARKVRSEGFGKELKRRFVIGAFSTTAEHFEPVFQKTKRVRTLICREFERALTGIDGLLVPAAASKAPLIADVVAKAGSVSAEPDLIEDILLLGNFAGCPSLTVPAYKIEDMPWGVNLMTRVGADQECLNLGATIALAVRDE